MQHKKTIPIFIALALALLLAIYAKRDHDENSPHITVYGNVDIRQVELSFRVFGKVKKLFVDEGDRVEVGQIVAQLDPVPYELSVMRSEASVKAFESELENAILQFLRRDEVSSAAISQEEYDNALFTVETLYNRLHEAKATYEQDIVHLRDCTIHAPSKGTILTRIREPGSVVQATEPIFTLSLDAPVWIRAYVNERQLGAIYPGMPAYVTTDTYPDKKILAHIGFISPVAEFTPKNVETTTLRTELVYRLRVIVDQPPITLRQGMPVTVTLCPQQS